MPQELMFYPGRSRMEVERNVQGSAQAGIQAQGHHVVDRQSPAEQLKRKDMPATLGNAQWAPEVHHLSDRGQQRPSVKSYPQLEVHL